jgi:hypothetical protein
MRLIDFSLAARPPVLTAATAARRQLLAPWRPAATAAYMAAFTHGNFDAFRFSRAELDGVAPIDPADLEQIAERFYRTGLVLLADVLPCELLDTLKPRLEEDVLRQLLVGEWLDIPTSDTTLSNPDTPPLTHPGHCASDSERSFGPYRHSSLRALSQLSDFHRRRHLTH